MTKREQIVQMLIARNPSLAAQQSLIQIELSKILKEVGAVKGDAGMVGMRGETGPVGPRGAQGPMPALSDVVAALLPLIRKPNDGRTPIKGVDYMTEADLTKICEMVMGMMPKQEVVKKPEINLGSVVKTHVDEHIEAYKKNLPTNESVIVSILRDPRLRMLLHGGGGSSVSNSLLTAGGTVDGNNLTFSFSQKPSAVVINGATYRENKGWSWSDPNITIDSPVGSGGDIWGLA